MALSRRVYIRGIGSFGTHISPCFGQVFYNPGTFDDFQSPVRDNCHDSQIIINVLIYDICMHAPGAVVRSKRGYEGDAPLNFKWFKLYRKALQS